ncbi:hypothetical protein T484DRAFT_1797886 [Baffinella frigidus]|nr:hypothetical protein T484DRAFT_1797886 [Cryptophyta sp. CCMP2293]
MNTATCRCTHGTLDDCRPVQQEDPAWLGARETWIQDTPLFRSSSYETGVDLDKVMQQASDALWHSGNGSGFASEHGCPHLPICPEEWPYDKDQWLAFDLGTHFSLSQFRIRYPPYALMPAYSHYGLARTNIREDYWLQGHPRDFAVQFSLRSLEGPWVTLLDGTAEKQAVDWQTFGFEPQTARYWRLFVKNNYGFGYTALQAIEFFGFQSRFAHHSNRCYNSILCSTGEAERASLATNGAASIRAGGLKLTAGRHAFFVHSNLGLQVAASDARRGEVHKSDGRVALAYGTAVEAMSPLFAFEALAAIPGKTAPVEVSPQALTLAHLGSAHGFVLVARFITGPPGDISGTVLTLGDPCSGGLSLWVLEDGGVRLRQGCDGGEGGVVESGDLAMDGGVRLRQGCEGGEGGVVESGDLAMVSVHTLDGKGCDGGDGWVVESGDLAMVVGHSEYTLATTLTASTASSLTERLAPLASAPQTAFPPSPFPLTPLPSLDYILLGAATKCGNHTFPGTVLAASVYQGM